MNKIEHTHSMEEGDWYSKSWEYFALLSGQRMQMIEFFISIELFLIGAFITLICLSSRLCWAEVTVALLLVVIAVVFWGFDYRTKTMLHECENAMLHIEKNDNLDPQIHPISVVNGCKKAKMTYTKWIICLYTTFIVLGLVGAVLVVIGVL